MKFPDGKTVKVPAYRWMRDVKTKKEATPMAWVFTGSKVQEDGSYAADTTGCLVGVINNELSVLDVPALKSRALEAREYESIEELVAKAEHVLQSKREQLEDPKIVSDSPRLMAAQTEMEEAQEKVDTLYARWAELEKKKG